MRYKAKVDKYLYYIIFGTIAVTTLPGFAMAIEDLTIYQLINVPVVGLMLWILFGSYYELRDDHLYMRIGPFFGKIKYHDIKSITETKNLLSSMALSYDRIEIRVRKKGTLFGTTHIAPLEKQDFLYQLRHRCPNLEDKNSVEEY